MTATAARPRSPTRGSGRAAAPPGPTTWWGKAWVRAVEESAYGDGDLRARPARWPAPGRSARSRSRPAASWPRSRTATSCGRPAPPCRCSTSRAGAAFVEAVAAEAGRLPALLAGDLPHALVEHAEEAGVELLPYGGELAGTAPAPPGSTRAPTRWPRPTRWPGWSTPTRSCCSRLRGLPREDLLARLHDREDRRPEVSPTTWRWPSTRPPGPRRILQLLEPGDRHRPPV